jgi:two-component system OmpR family sensor kinase
MRDPWHRQWRAQMREERRRWKELHREQRRRWKENLGRHVREHVHEHVQEHMHGHMHGHREWHRQIGDDLRHYYGAHLHRRIFFWFLASIGMTVALVKLVSWLTNARYAHGPSKLLLIGLAGIALFSFSGKIARRIARPLYELSNVASEIGKGNLGARAVATGRIDEIANLARAVNDMAARIERQIAGQRELLAAVSHELRTPLARLRVLLDIARERGTTEAIFTDWERELLEMDQLVGELLASARLDFQALSPSPLDGLDVARRALERAGAPADRLVSEVPAAPFIGDPTLLGRALANLLDNAHKHGRGLSRLVVSTPPGKVVFSVEDRGPGIPAALSEQVFEPFVQAPSGQGDGGAERAGHSSLGLGLALVARIARAHGGRVHAQCPPGAVTGACLVLELPLEPPRAAADARPAQPPRHA